MSLAINPVFENPDVDIDDWCDQGVPLLRNLEMLDNLAKELNLVSLGSFNPYPDLSIPDGFDGDPSTLMANAKKVWHSPATALSTVVGLLDAIRTRPAVLPNEVIAEVIPGLVELKNALELGNKKNSKFHLDVF